MVTQPLFEVTLQSEKLDEGGMVTDFYHLTWLREWTDRNIDHKFIIDINDPLMKIWFGDFKKDPTFIKRTDGMVLKSTKLKPDMRTN